MTSAPVPSSSPSSRERLLEAAKALMAEAGYEQTSTAAIVRRAATSESQLMRYFGGKAGLLQAVFDESWQTLNHRIRAIEAAMDARAALAEVLAIFIRALDHDPQLAALFLFEGRRVRGPHRQVTVSEGYLEFMALLHHLVRRAQGDGTLTQELPAETMTAALFGAAEGMVRERWLQGHRHAATYTDIDIRRVFGALLDGLQPSSG